jgi:hypothetical protein
LPARSFIPVISERFAVEFDRRTVGTAVRVPGGFMFYASDPDFDAMDGRIFRASRAIERRLEKLARRRRRADAGIPPMPIFA